MKINILSITILLLSFCFMLATILDWIPNNPLQEYKLIAALQFIILSRFIVRSEKKN